LTRHDGRSPDALRPVTIETGWHKASDGSVLYRCGRTVVLCTASIDEGVKDFLRGQGRGWVTAEYVMHPRANPKRQNRDGFNGRPLSGRSHEIARLIGRALRGSVDSRALGERTITIDCDVLEADGGTRTASVTGGMVALAIALDKLRRQGSLSTAPLRATVAAVSAGLIGDAPMLDLAYVEDRDAEMDLNVVATHAGDLVEVQATAEGAPVPRPMVDRLVGLALDGIRQLGEAQRVALAKAGVDLAKLLPG
jgi:ribonuclease PH